MLATTRVEYGPNLLARLLAAKSSRQVDDYAKAAWVLNAEGLIADEEMAYLAPIIEHQRKTLSANGAVRCGSLTSSQRYHRRPAIPPAKRTAAWLRRRALAKDCVMPTCLARLFTVSKLAVLAVIASAAIEQGSSNMSLPEIAARAGVGCTTARYAIRDASRMGLISVQENRCNSTWNRPNTIRITCKRWLDWLAGHRKARATRLAKSRIASPVSTPLRFLIPMFDINRFKLNLLSEPLSWPYFDPPALGPPIRR